MTTKHGIYQCQECFDKFNEVIYRPVDVARTICGHNKFCNCGQPAVVEVLMADNAGILDPGGARLTPPDEVLEQQLKANTFHLEQDDEPRAAIALGITLIMVVIIIGIAGYYHFNP